MFDCTSPGPTLLEVGTHDERCISKRIDEFVSLHRMTNIESSRGIIRRDQYEVPVV